MGNPRRPSRAGYDQNSTQGQDVARVDIVPGPKDPAAPGGACAGPTDVWSAKAPLLAWVMNSSVDAILVYRSSLDARGEVVDFECVLHNPAAERLYRSPCLEGERLLGLHPDLHDLGLWQAFLQVFKTGEPFEGEYPYDQHGKPSWFRVLAIKVEDGLALTFSDITHRKETEFTLRRQLDELERANRMKSEFLGVVSHELRTPINVIMGFVGILEDELVGPLTEAQHDCLRQAAASSERLLRLVNDLLDMRQIHAGDLEIAPQRTAFAPIVADVLANLVAVAADHVLVNDVPAGLPPVLVDPTRASQVVMILVGNAIKFTPRGGTIAVAAGVEAGCLRCEVRDSGAGVSTEELGKLFQTFSQVDMSSTRRIGGAGLGLRIAKHLVEAQGGSIGIHDRPGAGSIFWFTLPVARS